MAPSARATAWLGVAFVIAGASFDSPSLYLPGVALLALVAIAAAWVALAARGAGVARLAGPPTVIEGHGYPVRIRIRRGTVRPYGELVDPLLPAAIPLGSGDRELVLGGEVSFARRGRRRLEPARLIVRDPLGIRRRELSGDEANEVLVLPRVEAVTTAGEGAEEGGDPLAGDGDGGSGFGATPDVEVDGLRPYREGSPASRIHWPAVARHGELIERRLVSGGEGTALVVLDADRPASEEALDSAVRAAASVCRHLGRAGGCSLIVPGAQRPLRIDPQLRGWAQAHARLALVEPGDGVPGIAFGAGGTTFWVTARRELPARARSALGSGTSFVVTPLSVPAGRAVFEVAGCRGVVLRGSRAVPRRARSAA